MRYSRVELRVYGVHHGKEKVGEVYTDGKTWGWVVPTLANPSMFDTGYGTRHEATHALEKRIGWVMGPTGQKALEV